MNIPIFTALSLLPDGEQFTIYFNHRSDQPARKRMIGLDELHNLTKDFDTLIFGNSVKHNLGKVPMLTGRSERIWIKPDKKKIAAFMKRYGLKFKRRAA